MEEHVRLITDAQAEVRVLTDFSIIYSDSVVSYPTACPTLLKSKYPTTHRMLILLNSPYADFTQPSPAEQPAEIVTDATLELLGGRGVVDLKGSTLRAPHRSCC